MTVEQVVTLLIIGVVEAVGMAAAWSVGRRVGSWLADRLG